MVFGAGGCLPCCDDGQIRDQGQPQRVCPSIRWFLNGPSDGGFFCKMKIAYTGLKLPEGKVKYNDRIFADLAVKFQPAKSSPYYFEFLPEDYEAANAIAIARDRLLDLLILDMDKIEGRLSRAKDPAEKRALGKCLAQLEDEKPICDLSLDDSERGMVKALGLLSFKPTVVFEDTSPDATAVCRALMKKAGMMFFYTAGRQEVHAWFVHKGADAVTCADKIHSDLALGFIKAELVDFDDMMTAHNMNDARSRGLTKLVDRDYAIPENTILEIRFNV
jgi:hypothetical protein